MSQVVSPSSRIKNFSTTQSQLLEKIFVYLHQVFLNYSNGII
jgi:hypothetical protein